MTRRLSAAAALLLAAALLVALALALPHPAAAQPEERARHSPCTGIYTGAARGVFWCSVVAQHDAGSGLTTFRVDTDGDIQLDGDALEVVPGTLLLAGPPKVGLVRSGDAPVKAAWSTLRTGVPPTEADYAAARGAAKVSPDQGEVTLDLARIEAGPKGGEVQAYTVHGTFSARLPPLPGGRGVGEVRITVRF